VLSSITNEDGTALLTLQRATDGTGNIVLIQDCYNREVFYHDGMYSNSQVDIGTLQQLVYQQTRKYCSALPYLHGQPDGTIRRESARPSTRHSLELKRQRNWLRPQLYGRNPARLA